MHRAAPQSERLQVAGPAGALEARLDLPAAGGEPAAFGVICHPHPLHAGTLDNKVVHTLARACNDLGLPALRFNFRGVGASQGEYDGGAGETADALAVVEWGRRRWPRAALWLAGFSFGAAVAVRAAAAAAPQRLILVAPAVDRIDLRGVTPACPWLVLLGDADDVVSPVRIREWAQGLAPAPRLRELPGAGHYFHGRLADLREAVTGWVAGAE